MKKRPLGKTGIEVSEVSFGGVEIGIPYGIGIESAADMISEVQSIELLHASFDAGINFYDTARQYGQSENIIGKAFKGRRNEVVLCTKCKHFLTEEGVIPAYSELRKIVDTSLVESLEALQTDYVDVYMLHQGNPELVENENVARVFTDLKSSGQVRAIGVSTYTPEETRRTVDMGIWDVVQLPFNLMDQRQESLFTLASGNGIGIVVRSVLMKGLLSNRGKNLHPALRQVEDHIGRYDELLNKSNADISMLATKFALSFPEVSSILVGLDKMEYLERCKDAADGHYLDENLLSKAKSLAYKDPEFLNLHTWSKMGWLK
jgi:aryl-alcohol dehydrogenase-like predicted oxidoreductase